MESNQVRACSIQGPGKTLSRIGDPGT